MKKSLFFLFAAMMALSITSEAKAVSNGSRLNVSGSVNRRCTITTTPISFGAIFGVADISTGGTIKTNCTRGLPYKVYVDGGSHQAGANSIRRIQNSLIRTAFISYRIAASRSLTAGEWGTRGCASAICSPTYTGGNGGTALGTGLVTTWNLIGRTTTFNSTAGSYSDVVDAVVEF